MTTSANTPRLNYVADGATTTFTFNFEIADQNSIAVYVGTTLKTLTTDYTVAFNSGTSGTGTVTLTTAPSNGTDVFLIRDTDNVRSTDFEDSGAFLASTVNAELDRLTQGIQDLENIQKNSTLRVAEPHTESASLTIPNQTTRANKSLTFDASGNVTATAIPDGTITSIATGTGLTGGPITTTGTISIDTGTTVDVSTAQTLTNKTINANNNTLSNIANSSLSNSTITMVGDDSTGTAVSLGETFKIAGAGGVTTAVSGDTLTVTGPTGTLSNVVEDTTPQLGGNLDLNSNNITGTGNINIAGEITSTNIRATGNLTVDGTTTTLNTTNLSIEDAFIELNRNNSSTATDADAGIFIRNGYTGAGTDYNPALYWDHGEQKFKFIITDVDPSTSPASLNDGTTTLANVAVGTLSAGPITAQASKFYGITFMNNTSQDALEINQNNITGLRSNDNINIIPAGTGKLVVSGDIEATAITANLKGGLDLVSNSNTITNGASSGNVEINTNGTGNIYLSPGGNVQVVRNNFAVTQGTIENKAISIADNKISTYRSNDNLILDTAGTGKIQFNGNLTGSAGTITVDSIINAGSYAIRSTNTPAAGSDLVNKDYIDGQGFVDFSQISSLIANVVEDATPQLGGNLDINGRDITGTGNISITGNIANDAVSITDNKITTTRSNDDLFIDASGTGHIFLGDGKESTYDIENYLGRADRGVTRTHYVEIDPSTQTTSADRYYANTDFTGFKMIGSSTDSDARWQKHNILQVDLNGTTHTAAGGTFNSSGARHLQSAYIANTSATASSLANINSGQFVVAFDPSVGNITATDAISNNAVIDASLGGAGTTAITNYYSYKTGGAVGSNATITNSYGLYLKDWSSEAGTITNDYGVYAANDNQLSRLGGITFQSGDITTPAITIADNSISTNRSNDDLFIDASGTGGIRLGGGLISDNLDFSWTLRNDASSNFGISKLYTETLDWDTMDTGPDRHYINNELIKFTMSGSGSGNSNERARSIKEIQIDTAGYNTVYNQNTKQSITNMINSHAYNSSASASTIQQITGLVGGALVNGSGTNTGDLTVTDQVAMSAYLSMGANTGTTTTVTNGYGQFVPGIETTGGGTYSMTNFYGVYVGNLGRSAITNPYGVYVADFDYANVLGGITLQSGDITTPAISIADNRIQTNRSNDNLILNASGTGDVQVNSDLQTPQIRIEDNIIRTTETDTPLKLIANTESYGIEFDGTGTNTVFVTPAATKHLRIITRNGKGIYLTPATGGNTSIEYGYLASDLNAGNQKITNLGTPSAGTDAATKDYVDSATSGGAGISNVVEDTTPQLGGNLDVNGQSIVSTSAGNIAITPDTTGKIILDGLSWPTVDGSNGQVIVTDGAGNLSFSTVSAGGSGISNVVEDTTPQLGGTLDLNSNDITGTGNISITGNIANDAISITDNSIKTTRSNDNLYIDVSGTGVVTLGDTKPLKDSILSPFTMTGDGRVEWGVNQVYSESLNLDSLDSSSQRRYVNNRLAAITLTGSGSGGSSERVRQGQMLQIDTAGFNTAYNHSYHQSLANVMFTEFSNSSASASTVQQGTGISAGVGLDATTGNISITDAVSMSAYGYVWGAGNVSVTNWYGQLTGILEGFSGGGTHSITNYYGVYVNDQGKSSITNPYGFYSKDITYLNRAGTFEAYREKINALTSSSTITVDCSLAPVHTVALGTNTGFVISNLGTGQTVTIIIKSSGSYTGTFGTDTSTAVKFPGGAPTLTASGTDVVTIFNDGTDYLGNIAQAYA